MSARLVHAFASALELHCPYCGEPFPAPCGSEFWTLEEAREACTGDKRQCNSCDKKVRLVLPSRVSMLEENPGVSS